MTIVRVEVMLNALTLLLGLQLLGEVLVKLAGLPLPGPVVGLVLLFLGLCWRGRVDPGLADTSATLLANLGLLFVPAGVGVMLHARRLGDEGVVIILTLLLSTLVTLVVSAAVMTWLSRARGGDSA